MQTWKRKKAYVRPGAPGAVKPWRTRLAAVFFLLATVAAGLSSFPKPWNAVAGKYAIPEPQFRLGLDLQGGTHLVYEADMKDIPELDREAALEGVRDVIEKRVNAFGVAEPLVQTTATGGVYRLVVELAGVLDVKEAIKQIGETPVLEFREPSNDLGREPTAEEKKQLTEKNKEERATAAAALAAAQKAPAAFVTEQKAEAMGNITANSARTGAIAKAITATGVRVGRIVPRVIETPEGLNVVKYTGTASGEEMQLSHILVCFEGKTGCANPIPEIEATLIMNEVKNGLTTANFAERALQYSTDSSAQNSGKLDPSATDPWLKPGDLIPAFEIAARTLKTGQISDVVVTDFGYHIIYKRAARPVKTYQVERLVLPLSEITDIVAPVSPWKNTALSGKHLARAQVQFEPTSGNPFIGLQFNAEGGELFGELTARLVGQPIGIFLDGQPISTPVVESAIYGGQAVINGDFTLEEAKLLVQRLNAGALPVPINLLSQQTVGPTLGLASLDASIKAALIGFALVALFMILVYRLPGVVAVFALALYTAMNLLAYRAFGVTITLAGIAGLVLSIGIAVDANVLIFERMRDEARAGHDLRTSLEEGFKRAWPPIRDGHMTTFISAMVLYTFSSSFVRGFALTLAIGIILSLFSAITVTRAYLRIVSKPAFLQRPWFYGFKKSA